MKTRLSRLILDIRLVSASLLVSAGMQSANATIKSMSDSQMQSEHISLLPSMLVKKKKPKKDDCVYDKKKNRYVSSKNRKSDDDDECEAAGEKASDADDEDSDDDDADNESDKKQKAKGKGKKSGKVADGDDDGNVSVKSQQEESDSDEGATPASGTTADELSEINDEDKALIGLSSSYGGVNVTSGLLALNADDVTNDVVIAAVNFQNNQMLSAMSSTMGMMASTLDQVALNELNKSPYSSLMTGRNPDGTVTLKSGDFKQQQFETLYLYGTITNRLHEGLDYEIPSIEAGTREIKVIVPAK